MATVLKESVFFQRGGGGLTVSGGEPLSQPDFLLELLALAKKNRLNAALETAGVGSYAVLRRAADFLGTLFYDVKIVDDFKSQRVLGQASAGVLDNLRRLASEKPNLKIIVRVPLVPKVNDDPSAARDLGRFLAKVPNLTWELLPYHRFGEPKYAALNRPNPMGTATLEPLALARFQEEVNAAKALAS
jgi:pyruvate formate lyase activating enzyme